MAKITEIISDDTKSADRALKSLWDKKDIRQYSCLKLLLLQQIHYIYELAAWLQSF